CYARCVGRVADVEAIPGHEMPTKNVGSDWLRFDTDNVTLTLPPGYARVEPSRSGSSLVFENDQRRVALLIDSQPVSVREIEVDPGFRTTGRECLRSRAKINYRIGVDAPG
ncbi:MAG: hypothetical protein ABL888_23330, partial [Pirellulaceae bacterium]